MANVWAQLLLRILTLFSKFLREIFGIKDEEDYGRQSAQGLSSLITNMKKLFSSVLCAVFLAGSSLAAPALSSTSTSTAVTSSSTVPLASDDPNAVVWSVTTTEDVQPVRGSLGGSILGPQNVPLQQQNPDILAPPTTDAGSM